MRRNGNTIMVKNYEENGKSRDDTKPSALPMFVLAVLITQTGTKINICD
jgi:hypothetical protein